ncbi:MAG: PAS domain S-box protein, partial [Methanomicrobiales archaeon]|nr:PAS domain S-box protein [Methanomicrobiales archaeon]
FREMAETSPFPISIIDGDGRYRYLNRRFTEIFGYTLDDVPTGRRWFEQAFPDPDLRRETLAAWKGDLAGSQPGMVRPRKFPVRCRNGECREIIFRPVTLRDGTQYITYEDVTERLHIMDSLRQSEARFKHLFNSMRCCFTLVEPVLDEKGIPVDLTFREVNTAMERLSGRIREDLMGQQLRELYPNTPQELIDAIGAVALTGDPKKLVIYHPDFDRHLKIRAYSPWKGQCALIFRVVAPNEAKMPPGQPPPSGKAT